MAATPRSLDDYATANPRHHGQKSYIDTLPADIREQLLTSNATHTQAADWLAELGYDKAGPKMVSHWRQKHRRKP